MRQSAALLCAVLLATGGSGAAAFGPRGHEVIGAIADGQLTPAAKAAVARSLGYPLRVAAVWADCVRDVQRSAGGKFVYAPDPLYAAACKTFDTRIGEDRMVSYARRNWDRCNDPAATKGCHALYHFADVAIEHDHYDRAFTGTSDHDIVSAIEAAIAKLQGLPVPQPFSIKDKAEAILMLAHLVGDVHQPLHVGAVYLDAQDRPVDPGLVGTPHDPAMDTRGGNKLEVGSTNLHADWDAVPTTLDPLHVPADLRARAAAVAPTPGEVGTWPVVWASDTVKASQSAYAGLTFSHVDARRAGDRVTHFADRAAYLHEKSKVQEAAVATAGARLAQVLNAVLH